jgi:hypothetical protein
VHSIFDGSIRSIVVQSCAKLLLVSCTHVNGQLTGEIIDGQTIGQPTGEFIDGQTIGQFTGEFIDGQTIGQLNGH